MVSLIGFVGYKHCHSYGISDHYYYLYSNRD
jgi:hypothetical protein